VRCSVVYLKQSDESWDLEFGPLFSCLGFMAEKVAARAGGLRTREGVEAGALVGIGTGGSWSLGCCPTAVTAHKRG